MDPIPETIRRVRCRRGEVDARGGSTPAEMETWLARYLERAGRSGLSPTAIGVLRADTEYILHKGILALGAPSDSDSRWPESRLRKGLVLGSIQSGKTASMLGVAACSLDAGVDIVVILAGTRLALWRQTIKRTLVQLDCWSPESDIELRRRRVFMPRPALLVEESSRPPLEELYHQPVNGVRKALLSRRPLVALVMKHADHLIQFSGWLSRVLERTLGASERPLHMLVIDDEADDGSILDAVVEQGLEPDSERRKQIPRHIARLWGSTGSPYQTFHERVHATYLAYTATPQANFLQSDQNPLAPTDFAVALRTPFSEGSPTGARSITYTEPLGLKAYYTGGEMFYRRMDEGPGSILTRIAFPDRGDFDSDRDHRVEVDRIRVSHMIDSIRGFLVAAASQLLLSGRRYSRTSAKTAESADEIRAICPAVLSALVHPSSLQDEHRRFAEIIAAWAAGLDPHDFDPSAVPCDDRGMPELDRDGLVARLRENADAWKRWLREFEITRQRLVTWPGAADIEPVDESSWDQIESLLLNEVFQHVRLSIINSDPDVDDRPRFDPERCQDGTHTTPRDVLTIFVSGNVMSRGVTLEGLITTVFFRASTQPIADTQMQMQRWFGYRGSVLRWARVCLFEDQLELFRGYHEADTALRTELIAAMNVDDVSAPDPMILRERGFVATAKIANTRQLPLCPGADPFIRVIERGDHAQTNAELLASHLREGNWVDVSAHGLRRGVIREDKQLTMTELADLLDTLRYSHHDPDPTLEQHKRWTSLAMALGVPEPLFRPPGHLEKPNDSVQPAQCPYSIAAYLRLWDAALSKREAARGLYPTDDQRRPWNTINLHEYAAQVPHFYVGVRYGPVGLSIMPSLAQFGVRTMTRSEDCGVLIATWGSRNPGEGDDAYLGDQFFDYHHHTRPPPRPKPGEPLWRPRGEPGLALFHVICGERDQPDAVTLGLMLPLGGPDHLVSIRPPSRV